MNLFFKGHELSLKLLAVKGIGKDHAKFSPVSLATYKLLPEIKLTREFSGKEALMLQKCFSPGVIDIDKNGKAFVKNARYDDCSRNVYRYPELAKGVELTRVRNHFIFNVESLGAYKAEEVFVEAAKVLKKKCQDLLKELDFEAAK
jgi:DNA-directed RNA polymerase I and III subunit RPAC1